MNLFKRKLTTSITIPFTEYERLIRSEMLLNNVIKLVKNEDCHYTKTNTLRAILTLPLIPELDHTTPTKKEDTDEDKSGV